MARIWQSGFELNSVTAGIEWTANNGPPTISTTTVASGTYAGRASSLSSGSATGFLYQFASVTGSGPFYIRFAFRYHTLPSAVNTIFALNGAATFAGLQAADPLIKLTTAGKLQLFNNTQVGSDSAVLTVDTWYYVEMKYDKTAAGGSQVLEARLNGSVFATSSALVLNRAVESIEVGGNLAFEAQTTGDWFFDDVAINNSTGSFQNSYPGNGKILHLMPNATGDINTFATQTGGTAGSANNFTRVKEIPPDDVTTLNGSGTLNQEDLFNVTDSGIGSSDTVNTVLVGGRFRNNIADTVTAIKLEIEKAAAGTILQSAAIIPNTTTFNTNATTSPKTYPITTYQDPTSSNWTQTTLDSMQIGYKLTAAHTNRVEVTTVWASVDYTPAIFNISITQLAATLTATGGTQVLVDTVAIAQLAANLTATGGTQSIATVNNVNLTQVKAVITATGGTNIVGGAEQQPSSPVSMGSLYFGQYPISNAGLVNIAINQVAATITATGGTQAVLAVNMVTITQIAAIITATGGLQTTATVNDISITQLAANITATAGTQLVSTANDVSLTQAAATLTATGSTQAVATINDVTIIQVAANITAHGGIQVIASKNIVAISQLAATITATGGTQVVATVNNVAISQVKAVITATGGVQSLGSIINIAINQVAATITATGGTQVVASVQIASITQSAATLTATGGVQTVAIIKVVFVVQAGATVTATGGTQVVNTSQKVAIAQSFASVITTTGVQNVRTDIIAPLGQMTVVPLPIPAPISVLLTIPDPLVMPVIVPSPTIVRLTVPDPIVIAGILR